MMMNAMKRCAWLAGLAVVLAGFAQATIWAQAKEISGAGATFPYPV